MKRNFFGEMRIQPDDDLYACWNDEFAPEDPSIPIYARDVDWDNEFGWCCNLNDDDGNESECHDFDSEEALRLFLTESGVRIDD